MRRAVLMLAALAVVGLSTTAAFAWSGCGGSYHPGGYNVSPGYRGYGYIGYSHAEAVARIISKYSGYNRSTHPRSYYNSPYYYRPNYSRQPLGYYGQGYGQYRQGRDCRYGY